MSIVRDLGLTLQAVEDTAVITCSTASAPFASTGYFAAASTWASPASINGRLIDRLGDRLTQNYPVAMPAAYLYSTKGSTEVDRKLSLGIKLQHGDSSGGGDLADYSTGSIQDDAVFFSTARTTDMAAWTTGTLRGTTKPTYYDLRAAKRYIRTVVTASKNRVTTETSGDEAFHVGGVITFLGADSLPANAWTSAGSTSTST